MTATRLRFADPTRCPDCRHELPPEPFACPSCRLPLRSSIATDLLTTLATADDLLERLRASAVRVPAPAPAQAAVQAPAGPPSYPPYPAPLAPQPAPSNRGLQAASIPKILLGLGATCVLVAAVIFLAVAWSWLGVGGRTAVLVGLTAGAAGVGELLRRRGLRIAAEALTTIALGLLTLDVVGADDAGWLGDLSFTGLVIAVGAVLLVGSLTLLTPRECLLAPQLSAPFGLLLVAAGVGAQTSHHQVLAAAICLAFALMSIGGLVLRARLLQWTAGTGAVLSWGVLGLNALADALEHPTARELWLGGHGVGLVVAALLALVPWARDRENDTFRQGCCAFAAGTVTFVVALPGLDEGVTRATLVAVTATVFWAVMSAAAPRHWYVATRVPLAGSAVVPAGVAGWFVLAALEPLGLLGPPYSAGPAVRFAEVQLFAPVWLLPVCVAALVLAAAVALPRVRGFWWVVAGVAGATGLATLVLLSAPHWTVLLVLTAAAVALGVDALRRSDPRGAMQAATSGVLLVLAACLALPSAHLLAAVLAVLTALAATALLGGRFPNAAEAGGVVLPVALASLLWTTGEVLDTDGAFRGAPIMVVLGALILLRPRVEVELAAGLAALVASAAAIPLATDVSVSLAVHLTLAGAIVTASALIHPSRRRLAWLGGLLLASATWVRLADLGVEAPEPYTLPSAIALLLVGLHRLRSSADSSTMTALGPGLLLATVPSLLWVLEDPVSMRAALLGTACLCLVLGGSWSRWNAPVVIGSVVGGILVLRELAPYAAQTPQWIVIGIAGSLLIATGVTWESRVRDLRQAAAYLERLR